MGSKGAMGSNGMSGRQCYHCKQWIEEGEAHDCWTTTEAVLTDDLSEDLRDAWQRLREAAASLGEQRIYASHHCIMFSRASCYFFVRPKRNYLELCIFLGRPVKAPEVRRVEKASKTKIVNFVRVTHRDEVESPITDWLSEAYDFNEAARRLKRSPSMSKPTRRRTAGANRPLANTAGRKNRRA